MLVSTKEHGPVSVNVLCGVGSSGSQEAPHARAVMGYGARTIANARAFCRCPCTTGAAVPAAALRDGFSPAAA